MDPGREPRQTLRYLPKAVGHQENITVTLSAEMTSISVPLPHPPSQEPPTVFRLALGCPDEPVRYPAAADISCRLNILSAEQQGVAAGDSVLAWLVNQRGEGHWPDDRGRAPRVKFSIKTPSTADEDAKPIVEAVALQLGRAFSETATPLPEESVGPGARWKHVVTRSETQLEGVLGLTRPVPVTETAVYTLVNVRGETLTIDVNIERNADAVAVPATQASDAQIHSVKANGSDRRVLSLRRFAPVSTKRRMNVTIDTKVVNPQPDTPYRQWTTKFVTKLDVEGK